MALFNSGVQTKPFSGGQSYGNATGPKPKPDWFTQGQSPPELPSYYGQPGKPDAPWQGWLKNAGPAPTLSQVAGNAASHGFAPTQTAAQQQSAWNAGANMSPAALAGFAQAGFNMQGPGAGFTGSNWQDPRGIPSADARGPEYTIFGNVGGLAPTQRSTGLPHEQRSQEYTRDYNTQLGSSYASPQSGMYDAFGGQTSGERSHQAAMNQHNARINNSMPNDMSSAANFVQNRWQGLGSPQYTTPDQSAAMRQYATNTLANNVGGVQSVGNTITPQQQQQRSGMWNGFLGSQAYRDNGMAAAPQELTSQWNDYSATQAGPGNTVNPQSWKSRSNLNYTPTLQQMGAMPSKKTTGGQSPLFGG